LRRYALAFKHLKGRPLRTSLTVAALAISVGLMGLLLVVNDAFTRELTPYSAQRLVTIPKTSFFDKVPIAYRSKIEATPGVALVIPFDFLVGFYKSDRPQDQIPIGSGPPEDLLRIYKEANVPPDEAKAWVDDPHGGLIGRVLTKKYGWKVGDHVVLKAPVKGNVVEVTIRAVMRYDLDNGVYIHRKYFEGLTGDDAHSSMFWILAKSKEDVPKVSAALEKEFENVSDPIRAMSERQWQLSFFSMLGNVKALIGAIGFVTAFAVLLITSNTIAMAARERRGEAALLRILGFPRSMVTRLLFTEAAAYGVFGALFGCALMYAFARVIGAALAETPLSWMGALLAPNLATLLLAFALSLAIALGAGVVPALGLSRRSIVQLLRES
jgi:putative ABC transport system permease protein